MCPVAGHRFPHGRVAVELDLSGLGYRRGRGYAIAEGELTDRRAGLLRSQELAFRLRSGHLIRSGKSTSLTLGLESLPRIIRDG